MKKTIYASYGVLAHEGRPVFTVGNPASEIYDTYLATLPEGWKWAENAGGETLIESPDGEIYLANEIISNRGDNMVKIQPGIGIAKGAHIRLQGLACGIVCQVIPYN